MPRRPRVPPAAGPTSPQPTLCPLPRHCRDSMNPCPRPPAAVLGLHPSVLTALNPTAPGLCRGPSAFPPQPEGRSPGQATEPGPEGTRDRAARDTPLGPGSGRVGGAGSEETGQFTWAEHKNQGPVIDSESSTQTQLGTLPRRHRLRPCSRWLCAELERGLHPGRPQEDTGCRSPCDGRGGKGNQKAPGASGQSKAGVAPAEAQWPTLSVPWALCDTHPSFLLTLLVVTALIPSVALDHTLPPQSLRLLEPSSHLSLLLSPPQSWLQSGGALASPPQSSPIPSSPPSPRPWALSHWLIKGLPPPPRGASVPPSSWAGALGGGPAPASQAP